MGEGPSEPTQVLSQPASSSASSTKAPTTDQLIDLADLSRMRMFHVVSVVAPLIALVVVLQIGGDPLALRLFCLGAGLLVLASIGLLWITRKGERWHSRPVSALWFFSSICITPMLYYFGPFSAVVMVSMLGTVFIALGRTKSASIWSAAIYIGGHLVVAVPVIAGWFDDVGVFSSAHADRTQLILTECLIVPMLFTGYALGRWARATTDDAVAKLHRAMQVIGDQEQALAEVKEVAAVQQKHANEGRWTGHQMGEFKVGLVLGRGAMGDVYEATSATGAQVALKLLNPRSTSSAPLIDRFHREMEVAAKLASPHIVALVAVSPPGAPVPYIAMERLYGLDLATRLRDEPRMPSDALGVLLEQVGLGLEVARIAGVVHRDLKPHNLFLHDGGTWKILDFGVSKLVGSEGTLTGEGVVGTPQYMAPEQASGGHVTHLADVYALGTIAYRCLTGRTPFRGQDIAELVYQVVQIPPLRPSLLGKVSASVEDVLAVAMAKDPKRRFPSAQAFAQAFAAARRGLPSPMEPPPNAWTT